MKKKKYNLRELVFSLAKAAKDIPLKVKEKKTKKEQEPKKQGKPKLDKEEINKRISERQKKVQRLRNLKKARLKKQYKNLLRRKIELMEKEYKRLIRKKKFKKSDLEKIKNKLNKLKNQFKDL